MKQKIIKLGSKILILLFFICFVFTLFVFKENTSYSDLLNRTNEDYLQSVKSVTYNKSDMFEVMVELEDENSLSGYDSSLDNLDEYLNKTIVKRKIQSLESKQMKVINLIKENITYADFSNMYQYTLVTNGFSCKVKAGDLDTIYKMDGVKDVYISNFYEAESVEYTKASQDTIHYSDNLMDSTSVSSLGYTGEGVNVAILDTGMDVTHIGFRGDVVNPKYSKESLDTYLKSLSLCAKGVNSASSVYVNEKIPYAFDYANNDSDVSNESSPHGSHVAGIVGANNGETRGVSVNSQIFFMKVFSDSGYAYDTYILAALEDAVKLGVDVANMSLGSACGSSYVEGKTKEIYDGIKDKGINLMVSCGNDFYVGYNNPSKTNLPYASNPDYGVVGSPSTYKSSMSVASVDNSTYMAMYVLLKEGEFFPYAESTTNQSLYINNLLSGQTLDYLIVPGYGRVEDYEGLDCKNKVVVVSRGSNSFTEKHNVALAKGAKAIIVYNPLADDLVGMQIDEIKIPAIFISKSSFELIKNSTSKTMSFKKDFYGDLKNANSGQMSVFSSFGTTRDLEIKPEIASPGAYIYSTMYNNSYAQMSGTSMASPNLAGVCCLLKQYVNEKYGSSLKNSEKADLINTLIMSTADPVKDDLGVYSLVRSQGSGLANAMDAINCQSILSVRNSVRPKAELGSSEIGSFTYTFKVNNTSSNNITYELSTSPMREGYKKIDGIYYSTTTGYNLTNEDIRIVYSNNVVDNKITVAPKSSVEVTVTMDLTSTYKEMIDKIFINGSYVEGYTFLNTEDDEDLVIPFLGFYGDFKSLPLLEDSCYDTDSSYNMSGCFGAEIDALGNGYELGRDAITGIFYKDRIYFSCSALKNFSISSVNPLTRNVDYLKYQVFDSSNNLLYEKTSSKFMKAFYYANGGYITTAYDIDGWDGTLADGTKAKNGDKFTYVTTVGTYKEDKVTVQKEEVWKFDFTIDSIVPQLTSYNIVQVGDVTYLDIEASDNFQISSIRLYDLSASYLLGDGKSYLGDDSKTTIRFNLDEVLKIINEKGYNKSQIKVEVMDWAYNFVFTTVTLGPQVIQLEDKYEVAVGGSKDLSPVVIPMNVALTDLSFTSSDERIATIDSYGVVTGVSKGEVVITVSGKNGVVVTTKVVVDGSIDTSITIPQEDLSLTTGDTAILKATLTPLDVVDTNITWSSSDEGVVKITSSGYLEAVGVGEAIVTATSPAHHTDTIKVVVKPVEVTSIFMFTSQTTVLIGETKVVDMISITPSVPNYTNVIFTSSDETILKVYPNGSVKGIKEGVASIICSSLDGSVSFSLQYIVVALLPSRIVIPSEMNVLLGTTIQLLPQMEPINTTYKNYVYSSSNEDIVTVNTDGVVTPIGVGTTYVTISLANVTKRVYITVEPIEVESVSTTNPFVELYTNESKVLDVLITPILATYKDLIYISNNESIVKVVGGVVTGISEGTTTIQATSLNGKTIKFYIVVTKKEEVKTKEFKDIIVSIGLNEFLGLSSDELKEYSFQIEDPSIALITNGTIYGMSVGTTNVSVTKNGIDVTTFKVTINKLSGCKNTLAFNNILASACCISLIYIIKKKHQ